MSGIFFCSVKMQVIVSLLLFSHQLMTSAFPFPENDENFFPNLPDLPTSQDPSEEQVRYFFYQNRLRLVLILLSGFHFIFK